mmetsp:Transcript_87016/g.130476  ORF Transcript_87016/g.130476 Transcript_87016/m.130476 type:complete len:195 (+) Transcript_87016:3-587(+)
MIRACNKRCTLEVRHALLQGHDINERDDMERTPLHIACGNGDVEIITILLQDLMIHTRAKDYLGWSPLYYACAGGHVEAIKILLADPRIDNNLYHLFVTTSLDYLFGKISVGRAVEVVTTLFENEKTYFALHQATDCMNRFARDTAIAVDVGVLICTKKGFHPDDFLPGEKFNELREQVKNRIRLSRAKSANSK